MHMFRLKRNCYRAIRFPPDYLGSSQRAKLRNLRLKIVVPTSLPPGFKLTSVNAQRAESCATCDDYKLLFRNGNATIEFFGTNWTAGGDVDDNAFNAYFSSPIWGRGVVSRGMGPNNTPCLTAYALDSHGNTSFFLKYETYYYDVQACNTALAPADVARMIESAAVIRP